MELGTYNKIESLPLELLWDAKRKGFSDFQLARAVIGSANADITQHLLEVRQYRLSKGIKPGVRQIDTLAAEYPALTNYLYLTYTASESDVSFYDDQKSVLVLGSGAYRIGSSVEFDWCGVNALAAISEAGYRPIMINYNPETVSTDYDVSDRLYFDELTLERVLDIVDLEQPLGVILSTGGQIPNTLAMRLHRQGVRVLGTCPMSIDRAENRHKFSVMLDELGVDQPRWQELSTLEDVKRFVSLIGFPVLIRPSYVLSGAAMNVVSNNEELEHFLQIAAAVSKEHPVVVTEFIEQAKEIEIDAVADKGEMVAYAMTEHVEFAGVHSGDATMVFPPQKLYFETVRRIKRISRQIAKELEISGPFNIQFLARDNDIKVIECNLRASRSFPFVSKVLKFNFIHLATRIALGLDYQKPEKSIFDLDYIGVKASQFSFSRLSKADPVLGVDMASTGEVGCLGDSFHDAILKAMLSVGYRIPKGSVMISSGPLRDKVELVPAARMMVEKGLRLYATRGTYDFLTANGIEATLVHWPDEDRKPNVMDFIRTRQFDLVINIPKNLSSGELANDYLIRRRAVDHNIPLITNSRLASAFIHAFCRIEKEQLSLKSWREFV
jgi:carbamoyl-phosphate synthase large subunit